MYHIIQDSYLYNMSQRASNLKGECTYIQHQFLVVHYSVQILSDYLEGGCLVKPLFQSFPQILVTLMINQQQHLVCHVASNYFKIRYCSKIFIDL